MSCPTRPAVPVYRPVNQERDMLKRTFACAIVASVASGSAPAVSATWTAYNYGPSDSMANVQNFRKILGAIEEASGGEIKFRVRLGGSLPIQASNITQAVGNGTIQFADDGFFLGNVTIPGRSEERRG